MLKTLMITIISISKCTFSLTTSSTKGCPRPPISGPQNDCIFFSEKKKERRQDGLFDEEDLNRQWHELFGEWKILNKYVVQFHTELKKHLRLFHDHDYFNVMHALRRVYKLISTETFGTQPITLTIAINSRIYLSPFKHRKNHYNTVWGKNRIQYRRNSTCYTSQGC